MGNADYQTVTLGAGYVTSVLLYTLLGGFGAALLLYCCLWPMLAKSHHSKHHHEADEMASSHARRRSGLARRAPAEAAGHFVSKWELMQLHAVAVLLHTLSGTAGVYVAKTGNPKVDVVIPLFEFVTSASGEQFAAPRPQTVFRVALFTPLICVEFITAFFHLVYLFAQMDPNVDRAVREWVDSPSANPLRWVEYAITATTLSTFGSIAIGINDFYYFLRGVFAGVTLQAMGYIIEILGGLPAGPEFQRDRVYRLVYYVLGLLTNLPMVAILLLQTFGSETHSAFRVFVENALPLALWFNTFGIIAQMSFNKWRQFSDINFTERWYILLSLSTKITIFWVSVATFKGITEQNGFSKKVGVDWDVIRYCALSIPAGVVAAYALHDASVWAERGHERSLSHGAQRFSSR